MKKHKGTLIALSILLLIIGLFVYRSYAERTKYVKEDADGTWAGNVYNNGNVCEYEGNIYFSNYLDEGTLYVCNSDLSEYKKISDDRVAYINVVGDYIIYSRQNNKKGSAGGILEFSNVGVYRMDQNGMNLLCLDKTPAGMVHQYGNIVYYQYYDKKEAYSIYQIGIDGKEKQQIVKAPISLASIQNNDLYFTGITSDHNIHSFNLLNKGDTTLIEGNYANVMLLDNFLYCQDLEQDYAIVRMSLDGSNKETLVSDRTSTYNISTDGLYLFYQIDGGENNRLCKKNLSTGEETTLLLGDYHQINITNQYVFFSSLENDTMYMSYLDSSNTVNEFKPPVYN